MDANIKLQDKKLPHIDELKSIMLHNFSNREISLILHAINKIFPGGQERKKLIFAKTTEKSLKMSVQEWIVDTAEDHLHLLENPPFREKQIDQKDTQKESE